MADHPRSYTFFIRAVLFLSGLYCLWAVLDTQLHRFYIFQPAPLQALVREALDLYPGQSSTSLQNVIDHIVLNLTETHGTKHINTNSKEWFFNNAGGAMGAMYVIHASVTEYMIIFGTPLGTEGHSGRHTADDYFHILHGEQWAFEPGALEKEVYTPGMVHHLRRGSIKQYKMHEGCFALEYARGWIPLMLPFGTADLLTSTLDLPTLWAMVWITAREMGRNLLAGKF
ncbi:C-8 sterol isomerase [Dacryopinax primogenitus]|uniref:C-8 sterol isomerase n=1 Tax=Dacryopinax primogenitus (strain DJM 731) TaxID=1858805 RepID=M5G319_DACPD|nr:C-8 sterol isomerase [Dacryopinax primogenitus]EJU02620.1 C-8 sterol isomerase [Dacryopinax primogenitus]